MPMTHVVIEGERLSLDEARERAAQRDPAFRYTPELLNAILGTVQERDYLSTTSLTAKCLRQNALMRLVDYEQDIDGMWASFRGTMFHGQLEKNAGTHAIEEPRFFTDRFVDEFGEPLSGSPDLVAPDIGVLYDYKFTKENPRWSKPWPEHVEQCQINRWLVDHADRVQWRGWEFHPRRKPRAIPGAVQLPLTDVEAAWKPANFRPVDWQDLIVVYMDDKGVKPLRAVKSIDVPKASGEGTKKAVVSDIWSDEQVEELLDTRFPIAKAALQDGEVPAAPEGWEWQSHILCQYCPVRGACAEREAEGR